MPRRLLRDGLIVADDWQYLAELPGEGVTAATLPPGQATALILSFEQWTSERVAWLARQERLGVVLAPADKVEALAPDLPRLSLVGADFGSPSEGRGYTQARLLRERYGFTGEVRARGYVRRDLVFFMARCGFNAFELPDDELEAGKAAFSTFSAEYQNTNDRGLAVKPRYRAPGTPASA